MRREEGGETAAVGAVSSLWAAPGPPGNLLTNPGCPEGELISRRVLSCFAQRSCGHLEVPEIRLDGALSDLGTQPEALLALQG